MNHLCETGFNGYRSEGVPRLFECERWGDLLSCIELPDSTAAKQSEHDEAMTVISKDKPLRPLASGSSRPLLSAAQKGLEWSSSQSTFSLQTLRPQLRDFPTLK
jgi:hypothetical protein